jgi:hypothetical protein
LAPKLLAGKINAISRATGSAQKTPFQRALQPHRGTDNVFVTVKALVFLQNLFDAALQWIGSFNIILAASIV